MKSLKRITFLCFILFHNFLCSQDNLKENQALKFKQFSLAEGLSQSSVLCILQDREGFLWFGTRDGLNRFDGHNFINYRHNSQDTHSLSNNFIRSLFQDEQGDIWVGTMNGLNKFIPEENNFQRYSHKKDTLIKTKEIWDITADKNQNIWLATNLGLEKINLKSNTITEYTENNKELSSNKIRSLCIQNKGDIWICNTENIDVFNSENHKHKTFLYPPSTIKKETDNYAPVIYEDKEGTMWLGYQNGLWFFNKETKDFQKFKIQTNTIQSISSEVRSVFQDYLGHLWVGTYTGLYIIDKDKTFIRHFQHQENNPSSLSQNSIYEIFEDTKKDIWIGTYAGGINYYDRNYDLFKSFTAGLTKSKLNYKVVSSIAEDEHQNLWIGTEGGGINFYNKSTQLFEYYTHDSKNPNSISADNVKSIIKTKKGNLWIGTHDGGLNFLEVHKQPKVFKKYKNKLNDITSLSSNRVISLFEDETNNIWVGTSGGGLNVFKNNKIVRINDSLNSIGSIIYTISQASEKNTLWVGGNKGLAKLNTLTYKIEPLVYRKKQTYENTVSAILDVYEDALHNLWIGTEGDGLYYYDAKIQKSTKYDINNGLPNEVIYSVLPDDDNNLWLSTNNGLSRLNLSTRKFDNFNVSDGLTENEFNYGAAIKLKNNNLMFGGANGVNYFNPNHIVESSFIPPVSITSILVNNQPFLAKNNELVLKHHHNVFSFNFVALGYSKPKKCEYAYKLDGFDEEWNYIGNKRSATYTNLDAGTYTFKVKASNSNGVWNEKRATIKVKILPAPWKTWWAYFIYTIIIGIILLIIRKYSLLRIEEKNELKQERLEKEKLEEINQLKLQLFTNISHDFRTPLTLIIGPLESLIKEGRGNEFVQNQHKIMYRNAKTLLQLVNQLLDFRKSQSGKIQLKASRSNIVSFIENIKLSFDELARVRNINYSYTPSNTNIYLWYDKINLKKVILNLLSNAFKFTPDNGAISIDLSTINKKDKKGVSKDFVKLVVKDSGKGVPKKSIKLIFERFYQLEQNGNVHTGTGIGLALAKSLIKLHHGSIKVVSKEGKGTSFIVLLPLGKNHLREDQIVDENKIDQNQNLFLTNTSDFLSEDIVTENIETENEVTNKSPTILVVEDNLEVRKFVKSNLKKNYNIIEAENGKVGLEITKNHIVDLIISDVMMPEMNGMEFCDKIKTNISTSHIPVILLTAKTSEESQKEGYKTGADAYILKPFDSTVLEIRVDNLIKARKALIEKYRKEIILEPKKVEVESEDELFLQKAINLIEDNMQNSEYTIQDFISDMGMSRSALYRKLKALTNQTIIEFIRTIKLKKARQLIVNTQLNISEIAFSLGFNDLKHFRKTFKELFNELPSECRTNASTNLGE